MDVPKNVTFLRNRALAEITYLISGCALNPIKCYKRRQPSEGTETKGKC